jgi:hypothetical protein
MLRARLAAASRGPRGPFGGLRPRSTEVGLSGAAHAPTLQQTLARTTRRRRLHPDRRLDLVGGQGPSAIDPVSGREHRACRHPLRHPVGGASVLAVRGRREHQAPSPLHVHALRQGARRRRPGPGCDRGAAGHVGARRRRDVRGPAARGMPRVCCLRRPVIGASPHLRPGRDARPPTPAVTGASRGKHVAQVIRDDVSFTNPHLRGWESTDE